MSRCRNISPFPLSPWRVILAPSRIPPLQEGTIALALIGGFESTLYAVGLIIYGIIKKRTLGLSLFDYSDGVICCLVWNESYILLREPRGWLFLQGDLTSTFGYSCALQLSQVP